jgi:hypothetical protein
MKVTRFILPLLVLIISRPIINAQSSKYNFYAEISPIVLIYGGNGDGFQIGIERTILKKSSLLFTYGVQKRLWDLSLTAPLINGKPIVEKSTYATIFTPKEERIGGVPDISLFELLEAQGIKHYKPLDGKYVTNYASLEMLRNHSFHQKWGFNWGFGAQLGIMNRDEVGGGLNDSVNYFGEPIETWITYQISARYLYYGFTNRLSFTRKINNHFSVGISSGLHLSMAKRSSDDLRLYLSILAKSAI